MAPVGSRYILKQSDSDALSTVVQIGRRLEPGMRRTFLRAIEEFKNDMDLDKLELALMQQSIPLAETAVAIEALKEILLFDQSIAQAVAAGALAEAESLNAIGITLIFDDTHPAAVNWIRAHSAELVVDVTDKTKIAIREVIARSFEEAIPPRDAARHIRDLVGLTQQQAASVDKFRLKLIEQGVSRETLQRRVRRFANAKLRQRSQTIAVTEINRAANEGQQFLWNQALREGQLVRENTFKDWIVTPDDALDEIICEPLPFMPQNQEVKIDEPFMLPTGGTVMTPPAHPRCRCAMGLRIVRPKE